MCPGESANKPEGQRNLILTGFMGTGKTSVGQVVARRLGLPFVDMDAEMEAQAGKSIPLIFAEDGEDVFRRLERAFCEELESKTRPMVIATGGGALVNPANRATMMQIGTVICLTCSVNEILRRVRQTEYGERPLLDVIEPKEAVVQLLDERRQAYDAIPWQIDTTGLTIHQVAEQVLALAGTMMLTTRHPNGQYPIHIGPGLLPHIGGALKAAGIPPGSRVALVSNTIVAPLYGAEAEKSLRAAGYRPSACTIPDGEQHKTLATIATLYEQFLAQGLDRSGTVLSLGGGVTGDIAGFAAATFMRGVPFVQVPTTILAMADASVGGKTGIDLPQGKNLVGAFKQPVLVVMDSTVLATLPRAETRSGMAEVIKHGIIADPDLFSQLQSASPNLECPLSASQLARTLHVKIDIVEQDPHEQGRRAILNLGHTVGHALERLSQFTLRHGEAVSIGMVAAAHIADTLGRADASLPDRIAKTLEAWGLPVQCPPFRVDDIWEAMDHDKKRRGRAMRWILPHAIGHVEIADDVPRDLVLTVLLELGAHRS
jgi:3-dehydroquinate synthase